ncbi:MAG TPA: cytochrome c biogenesis protein CcsA [Candidatus Eisenbacteria bacterium]|nr:cytochrome c biogenesis protein CcsA [Candidatus Eisenbacteria bacterium]
MGQALFLAVFAGYLASFALYFVNFEIEGEALAGLDRKLMGASLTGHFLILAALFAGHHETAKASQGIYALAFVILLVSFLLEGRFRAKYLMLFSLPITLLFSLFALLLSHGRTAAEPGAPVLWLHLGLILAGFASLLAAASSALLYLLQSAQLKSKHLGRIFIKLPSLDTLDRVHFGALSWGVVLFSLGILTGLFGAAGGAGLGGLLRDPRVILSFLTCAMYWLVLCFRLSTLRRGQKVFAGTLALFILLIVTWMSSYAGTWGFHRGF